MPLIAAAIANVALTELEIALWFEPFEVALRPLAGKIVDDDNVVALPQIAACGVATNESGTASDDDFLRHFDFQLIPFEEETVL